MKSSDINFLVVLENSHILTSTNTYRILFKEIMVPILNEVNEGDIILTCYKDKIINHIYTFSGNYPMLAPSSSFTDYSTSCKTISSIVVGKYGNVECTVQIDLQSIIFPIARIQIKFRNPASTQLVAVYPDCEAYIRLTGSQTFITPSRGQIICSRQDEDEISPILLVTGFEANALHSIDIRFRARMQESITIHTDLSLEVFDENNNFVPMIALSNLALTFSSSINNQSKLFFFNCLLIIL